MDERAIAFAVVQSGYGVFGAGSTYEEAIADAVQSIDGVESAEDVEALLVNQHRAVDGDFYMLESDDEEFDGYMESQGCFRKRDGEWREVKGHIVMAEGEITAADLHRTALAGKEA